MDSQSQLSPRILELSDTSEFAYLDSGVLLPKQPYTTFIFIHGALFNHQIWNRMLTCTPSNTRLLAPSTRGYKLSSSFKEEDGEEIRARLGHDLSSIIEAFIIDLSLLSHPGSNIKLLTWSLGVCSLISTYDLLARNKLTSQQQEIMRYKISEIIIFEPPATLGLGLSASAFTTAYRHSIIDMNPEDMFIISMAQVTGFYNFPEDVISRVEMGVRDELIILKPYKSSYEERWFGEAVISSIDPAPIDKYLKAATPENENGIEYGRISMKEMFESEGVRSIKLLSTRHTVVDCIEGVAELVRQFTAMQQGKEMDGKMKLKWIEGEYNHFVHVYAPEVLWSALLQ